MNIAIPLFSCRRCRARIGRSRYARIGNRDPMENTLVPIHLRWTEGGQNVSVAGSFNNWTPKRMQKKDDGTFEVTVEAPPGEVEFKFIVDGEWKESRNYETKLSSMNSLNNVQLVEILDRVKPEGLDTTQVGNQEAKDQEYEESRPADNSEACKALETASSKQIIEEQSSREENTTSQDKLKENQVTVSQSKTHEKIVESGKGWKSKCCVS